MNSKKIGIMPFMGDNDIVKTTEIKSLQHEVFLDEEIGDPSEYRELLSLLFNANDNDQFTVYINTPGGMLSSTLAIIEGLKHTPANVTGVLMGETHSGGSLIAMYCHGLAVLDSAEMMIHTASFGSAGFSGNVKAHTDFTVKQVEKLIDEAYAGFLSKDEMEKVKMGVELWFSADDIRSRMESRMKYLEAELEAEKKKDDQVQVVPPKPKKKSVVAE